MSPNCQSSCPVDRNRVPIPLYFRCNWICVWVTIKVAGWGDVIVVELIPKKENHVRIWISNMVNRVDFSFWLTHLFHFICQGRPTCQVQECFRPGRWGWQVSINYDVGVRCAVDSCGDGQKHINYSSDDRSCGYPHKDAGLRTCTKPRWHFWCNSES